MSGDGGLPRGKVIVAGCTHGGLAAIRSLGSRGLHVIAISYEPTEHAFRSRYISEREICPHPRDERAFVEFLLARADRWAGALIIETNDYYATALARHKEQLAEHYRLVVPDWPVARTFIEKDLTYELAERCGVAYPRCFKPTTAAELESCLGEVQFPVMVKPVRSHEFVAVFRTKLFVAETPDELRCRFRAAMDAAIPVVIAEVIPGTDYKTLERVSMHVDSHGDVVSELYTTKLRQTPPMFGMNKVSVTTPEYPEVRAATLRLLEAVDFRGNAGVEFKRDPRDGQLKLIEVNVRLLADAQLSISAGIDTPWLMYQDVVNGVRVTAPPAEEGIYFVHLLTDLVELVTKERDRWRNRRRLLEPYLARRRAHAYLSWRDPMPALDELVGRARRFARKRRRR